MELRRYLDPRTTWRDTSEVDKVRLYTRQSFVAIIVVMGIAGAAEAVSRGTWVALVAMTVSAVTSVLVILRLPEIGGLATGSIKWPLATAVVTGIVAAVTGSEPLAVWALLVLSVPITAILSLAWSCVAGVLIGAAAALTPSGIWGSLAAISIVVLMAVAVRLSIWMLNIVTQLDASRHAASQLSVAEERLRFSRDLHDVVGRALSAIAVKSELAATLSRRGDERAAAQMDEVRDLAQQSMTEARQLVRGYRSIDLRSEINGATSLLSAAGIDTTIDGTPSSVAPEYAEAAAWIVREGATNILRHSDATYCSIHVSEDSVRIVNDRPHVVKTTDGTGIAGLRERLTNVGGTLDTTCTPEQFTLTALFAPKNPGHSAGSTPRLES